jgi:tRNA dimethylallyltransferase
MRGVPHHLIDFLEPTENFSVADYIKQASAAINDINSRKKLPIICGGTGLYFSSLIDNIKFSDAGSDLNYREELRMRAKKEGAEALLKELAEYDHETAAKLHPNNLSRIIRAMEHYKISGIPISQQNRLSRMSPSLYEPLIIGIDFKERENLYAAINLRTDEMLQKGLIEEAKWYFSQSGFGTASAAIGYKELKPYFDGECTLNEATENLKRETRRYAKRQLTWFRRDKRTHWIYADDLKYGSLTADALKIIENERFLKL